MGHFGPLLSFYTPRKHQKPFGFLVFSRGTKWVYWPEMSWYEQVRNPCCDNILPNLNISRLVIGRLYTDVKITNNTKMIHIMVLFSDYQNSIFIERSPYKSKNWQLHGILQISVQISMFSSHMQMLLFQPKNVKNSHSSTSDSMEYTKPCIKKKTCSILFYENGSK